MTTVTVCVPLTIRRRGGRKMIISPDGVATPAGTRTPADVAVTRGDPALLKALARAFRWRRMLETGTASSVSDIARQEKVTTSYVSRILRMTLLAPDIVEAILDGRQAPEMTLPALMAGFPTAWAEQVVPTPNLAHAARICQSAGRARRPTPANPASAA